jgi:hypothetical protein
MRITVNRYDNTPKQALYMQEWVFEFLSEFTRNTPTIRLTYYREVHKDNTRQRNWRIDKQFSTYDKRSNNVEPSLPDEVVKEAKDKIIQTVNEIRVAKD